MTPVPHPLNCKTCHAVIGEGTCRYSGDVITLIGAWSENVRIIWKHTEKYGCASHSSGTSAEQVLDFINVKWVREYCNVETKSNTDRWERGGRPKNDAYLNGSHSGYVQALQDLLNLLERIERIELRQREREQG